MSETNGRFKAKAPRPKAPTTRVVVSAEAAQAYEQLVQERDDRERRYGRHLDSLHRKQK